VLGFYDTTTRVISKVNYKDDLDKWRRKEIGKKLTFNQNTTQLSYLFAGFVLTEK
jgi:hypothetical protein